jgi:hypothetical protein
LRSPLLDWLPTVALFAVAGIVGPQLGAITRLPFVLACFVVGWYAWSRSPGTHVQVVIVMFSFAPLLRRLVDFSAGFDPGGLMIAGPLLALLAPAADLLRSSQIRWPRDRDLGPYLVFGACVAICAMLTVAQGELSQAASGSLKWGAPLLYALALYIRGPDTYALLRSATAAFAVTLPITGLYGLYQYVDPPLWDRYWLALAAITSAGLPEPYAVRTFSTMHSPASFATFTAIGLMLVYFRRSGWPTLLLMAPSALALMLSLYRTAWLSLLAGMAFCLMFPRTRRKAAGSLFILASAVVIALAWSPFAEVIAERLSTLTNTSSDSSAQERLAQYSTLWSRGDSGLLGTGFVSTDTAVAGEVAVDGMIASCWSSMGIVVGLFCLASLVYVIFAAIDLTAQSADAIVLGGIACGWLVQLPLASITSGELGFLFWAFATLSIRARRTLAAA